MAALTRGPLPARVYWVRRLVVLAVAALLVTGIARVLGGGSDGSDGEAARLAADSSTSPSTSAPGSGTPTVGATATATDEGGPRKHRTSEPAAPTHTPLPEPEGACADEDVAVTPEVQDAEAGRDVTIELQLRTLESEACTWDLSRSSLALTITSGRDAIWSSRDCPRAIPEREVVVRKDQTTEVDLTWDSRRSDETCSKRTEWAMPGWYHVSAAALGGEPSDVQFELATPTAQTVTKTAKPHQQPSGSADPGPSGRPVVPSEGPSGRPPGAGESR